MATQLRLSYLAAFVVGVFSLPALVDCLFKDLSTQEFNQKILAEHNKLRKKLAIDKKASYMYKLSTDDELVRLAKEQVKTCKFMHFRNNTKKFDVPGQNILQISLVFPEVEYTPEKAAKEFYFEEKQYNYDKGSCVKGKTCDQFTQVVWAYTKYLGCAYQFCRIHDRDFEKLLPDIRWIYISCNYGPGGSKSGKPYEIGKKPCEKCPKNCVDSALCETTFPRVSTMLQYSINDFEIPKSIKPGIIMPILDAINVSGECEFMLCAEAKKVTAGVDKNGSDVVMFGHESGAGFITGKGCSSHSRMPPSKFSSRVKNACISAFFCTTLS